MMNPTHSFDAEREVLRALSKQRFITYCGYVPRDRRHNKKCGHQNQSRRKRRPRATEGGNPGDGEEKEAAEEEAGLEEEEEGEE